MFGNKENHKKWGFCVYEDNGSIRNDLEMHPSGRDGGRTVVVVDEFSKSPLLDGSKQTVDDIERVRGNGVVIEDSFEKLANNDIFAESCGGMRRDAAISHEGAMTTWRMVENPHFTSRW